jgi:hypothetical protein
MNRYGLFLRNLLLFALVGWAGVDDYFPTVATGGDFGGVFGAENAEYVLFDGAGCRPASTTQGLAPSACRSSLIARSLALSDTRSAARSAAHCAVPGGEGTDHLYALMLLRC